MNGRASRWLVFATMFAVGVVGCGASPRGTPDGAAAHSEHGEHGADEGHGAHGNEAHVTADARARAGLQIEPAQRRALSGGVAIPAEVEFDPASTAHMSPLVAGRITRVLVSQGESVRRGQLLGVVASTDVSSARARLGQAAARLAAAESTYRRQQQLSSEGIGAQRALIDADAQVGELRAEVSGLRRQLSVFGSGSAGELSLRSPMDGVLVSVHATIGETASPDTPTFIVTDPSRVWIRGSVPELEISRLHVGDAAIVRLHAFPEIAMRGTLTYVAPALDSESRSLPIRVTLGTPDARLRGGLFGSIELIGGRADERVIAVPVDAVASIDGQDVVFVPADEADTFRPREVQLGRRAGGFVEVRGGLAEGDRYISSGAFTMKSILRSGELSEGHTD